jgi:outer membrane protein OmpA-like peptidoglycan-associated protein
VQRADKTAETRNRFVSVGTIDHGTAAITTAQVFGQSEKGGRGVKTMAFESIFRKASVALVAGAFALFVEAASVVQAQTRMIARSPLVRSGASYVSTAERIVLHGVCFQAQSDRIDKSSVPVLDYAVQIIKQNPEPLIYVKVRSDQDTSQEYTRRNSKLTNRRTQAVASYFERRGISANRLILLGSGGAPHTFDQGSDKPQSLRQNFEVVQLDLASGLD